MHYLGIEQHVEYLEVSLRDSNGLQVRAARVSTQPEKIGHFFRQLTRERLQDEESFLAILEVGEYSVWLVDMLEEFGCHKVFLIEPEDYERSFRDRRCVATLSELLWVYRDQLLTGKRVYGMRLGSLASDEDRSINHLQDLRKQVVQARTRVAGRIKHLLQRHNLHWEMPTKSFPSNAAIRWLQSLDLPEIERLELDYLLRDLDYFMRQIDELEVSQTKVAGGA